MCEQLCCYAIAFLMWLQCTALYYENNSKFHPVISILEQYNSFAIEYVGVWFLAAEAVVLSYFVAWSWETKSVATVSAAIIHLSR